MGDLPVEFNTWRRDELADKPIEILAVDDEPPEEQPAPEAEKATAEAPRVGRSSNFLRE